MNWQLFECLAGVLWTKQGYACYRTPGSSDNGVDVVALGAGTGELIQAKSSERDGATLGWDAVKDVVTGEAFYKRRHPNYEFEKVCITNQFFNRQAKENAALNSVTLVDQTELNALLQKHTVTMLEVERMRYANWEDVSA
jgi:HJR/Mrr/RecB family endonuclease